VAVPGEITMVQAIPFTEFQTPKVQKKKKGGFLGGLLKPLASIAGAAIGFVTGGPAGAAAGFKIGSMAGGAIEGVAEGDAGAVVSVLGGTALGELVESKIPEDEVVETAPSVAGTVPPTPSEEVIDEAMGLYQGAPSLGQYIYGQRRFQTPQFGMGNRPRRL
jgi:hypothetical protein